MTIPAHALSLYPVCRAAAQLAGQHPVLTRRARMLDALHAGLGSERDPFLREHYNKSLFAMPEADRTLVVDALGAIQVLETGMVPYQSHLAPDAAVSSWGRQVAVDHLGLTGLADYVWHPAVFEAPMHIGAIYFRGDKPAAHRSELLALAVALGATWGIDAITAHELEPQDGKDNEIPVTGILGPDGQAAKLEAFCANLARVEKQPVNPGTHCLKCDQRRWCPAWYLEPARDIHHTLVPLLNKRRVTAGGKAEPIADADVIKSLRVAQSMREIAHRVEMAARAEFDARGGRPFLDGTRWAWWPRPWAAKPQERWDLTGQGETP